MDQYKYTELEGQLTFDQISIWLKEVIITLWKCQNKLFKIQMELILKQDWIAYQWSGNKRICNNNNLIHNSNIKSVSLDRIRILVLGKWCHRVSILFFIPFGWLFTLIIYIDTLGQTSRSLSVVNNGGRKAIREGIDMLEAKFL